MLTHQCSLFKWWHNVTLFAESQKLPFQWCHRFVMGFGLGFGFGSVPMLFYFSLIYSPLLVERVATEPHIKLITFCSFRLCVISCTFLLPFLILPCVFISHRENFLTFSPATAAHVFISQTHAISAFTTCPCCPTWSHWITTGGECPLLARFLSASCSVLLVITNSLVPLSWTKMYSFTSPVHEGL
jgi:hypothetical protein